MATVEDLVSPEPRIVHILREDGEAYCGIRPLRQWTLSDRPATCGTCVAVQRHIDLATYWLHETPPASSGEATP